MSTARWLEFQGSTLIAVKGTPACVCVDLDGYVHQWEGVGSSRCGTGWVQRARIEVDFPDVDQGVAALPAALSGGTVVFHAVLKEGKGGVAVPATVDSMVTLELVATSGEKLTISGERLRVSTSGEARFVAALPDDMDPTGVGPRTQGPAN